MEVQTRTEALKQQTLRVAQARPELNPALTGVATDLSHNLAWTAGVNYLMSIEPTGTFCLSNGLTLHTAQFLIGATAETKSRKPKKDLSAPVSHILDDIAQANLSLGPFDVIITLNTECRKSFQSEEASKAEVARSIAIPAAEVADAAEYYLPKPLPPFAKVFKVGPGVGNKVWSCLHEYSEVTSKAK